MEPLSHSTARTLPMTAGRNRRVLLIHKGGKVLTWCADLLDAFREAGCDAATATVRSSDSRERLARWSSGKKLLENHATVQRLAGSITAFQPDLIVWLNFAGIPAQARDILRAAAGAGVPMIGWLADHISGLPAWAHPNLDGVYAFDSATLPVLRTAYAGMPARLSFLPLAVNPNRYRDHAKPWHMRRKGLVFLGNNTASRRELITECHGLGAEVSAYGPQAEAGMRLWRRRRIASATAARIYGSYQGVLNLLQPPNTIHGLNLRAFEVPACGGLGTYPVTPDLHESFAPGQEIIAFSTLQDLVNQTTDLFHDPQRAETLVAAGRRRVLADHTFLHRARRMLADWLP